MNSNFWKDRKVFLTGHTGFKGGWVALWLTLMGAKVYGYSLEALRPSFFVSTNLEKKNYTKLHRRYYQFRKS